MQYSAIRCCASFSHSHSENVYKKHSQNTSKTLQNIPKTLQNTAKHCFLKNTRKTPQNTRKTPQNCFSKHRKTPQNRFAARPGAGTPEKTETQDMKASSNARQRNQRGAAPKHRGGKHHKGGNRPQGNPTRQHTPHRESSTRRGPRCKIGRGGRRSSDFCVKQRAPPTAGSCSHRVTEKLYASKEDPRTSA